MENKLIIQNIFLLTMLVFNFWFDVVCAENRQDAEVLQTAPNVALSPSGLDNETTDKFFSHARYEDFTKYQSTRMFEIAQETRF